MTRPLETDGEDSPALRSRGEVIGKVVPRTTLRPATAEDEDATDEELANLVRRTDPRTEGDAPSIERVRSSLVDAVGTAGGSVHVEDVPPEARARAIVEELHRCGPGDESAHLEPLRLLGEVGLAALAENFPGLLWFDRRLPHRKTPRGRDASPMCSLLVALGASAAPVVRSLLDSPEPATRFYATLVASDLEVPSVVAALAARAFDEDADVREVALGGLAELARARERRPGPADAMARALDEAAARVRLRIGAPGCTPFERMHAVVAARALRDPRALPLLAPFAAWIERDLAAVAREALTLITAHDFGADAAAWQKWIRRHGEAPRVEWLVAALSGPKREMRAYAHVELVRVLGRDFGYSAEMGPIDRMVAQRRATKLARERGFVGGPR